MLAVRHEVGGEISEYYYSRDAKCIIFDEYQIDGCRFGSKIICTMSMSKFVCHHHQLPLCVHLLLFCGDVGIWNGVGGLLRRSSVALKLEMVPHLQSTFQNGGVVCSIETWNSGRLLRFLFHRLCIFTWSGVKSPISVPPTHYKSVTPFFIRFALNNFSRKNENMSGVLLRLVELDVKYAFWEHWAIIKVLMMKCKVVFWRNQRKHTHQFHIFKVTCICWIVKLQ